MAKGEKPAVEDLRKTVVEHCEKELRKICREGSVDPEVFLRGLRQRRLKNEEGNRLRLLDIKAKRSPAPIVEVERIMRDLTALLERSQTVLAALTAEQNAALSARSDLKPILTILKSLSEHPDLEFKRYSHRDRPANLPAGEQWPPMPDESLNRRGIVAEFAVNRFLGLRRRGTVRELAVLCLYFDPEHGCTDRRYERDKKTSVKPMATFYDVLKAEMDLVRQVVATEPLAKIQKKETRES